MVKFLLKVDTLLSINWEKGSQELQTINEIMTNMNGIYGGRFSGTAFKGYCVAIINPNYEQEVLQLWNGSFWLYFRCVPGNVR